jgi:N-acetylglutamate synthase-like GNAT family acetyltransferase/SAM-dependent methyltransferase
MTSERSNPEQSHGDQTRIRRADRADLAQVQALLSVAQLPLAGVAEHIADSFIVAQTATGEIIGLAGLEIYPPYALLRSVAVAPAWRGRGIAAQLVEDRMAECARRGLTGPYLLTTSAVEYFARQGFIVASRDSVPAEIKGSAEFATVCPSTATVMVRPDATETAKAIHTAVRRRYGAAARAAARAAQATGGCCSGATTSAGCCGTTSGGGQISADLYDALQTQTLPEAAVLASLGCGNPTALIELKPGETVLDLGSGGGIDVLLSARRVGPTGKAYGLDLTPDMISLARRNAREAGVDNAEFIRGEIENIPLAPASVDVVISNCVINLSHDKAKVLREAYRVLRPGGRFAVTDIVVQEELPAEVKADLALWTSCVAGALSERTFTDLLQQAGFSAISIEPVRRHRLADLGGDCCGPTPAGCGCAGAGSYGDLEITSAFVRATKPLSDLK